jgi:hypothetical protein
MGSATSVEYPELSKFWQSKQLLNVELQTGMSQFAYGWVGMNLNKRKTFNLYYTPTEGNFPRLRHAVAVPDPADRRNGMVRSRFNVLNVFPRQSGPAEDGSGYNFIAGINFSPNPAP